MNDVIKEKQNKREKIKNEIIIVIYNNFIWLILIFLVFSFYLAYIFLLYPKYQEILSGKEIKIKQMEYSLLSNYLKQLNDLENIYNKISKESLDKINYVFLNTNKKEDLFNEIEYIANKNEVKIEGLQINPIDNVDNFLKNFSETQIDKKLLKKIILSKASFTLNEVSYEKMIEILKTIENNLRIMNVEVVKFQPRENKAYIEFVTYSFLFN